MIVLFNTFRLLPHVNVFEFFTKLFIGLFTLNGIFLVWLLSQRWAKKKKCFSLLFQVYFCHELAQGSRRDSRQCNCDALRFFLQSTATSSTLRCDLLRSKRATEEAVLGHASKRQSAVDNRQK